MIVSIITCSLLSGPITTMRRLGRLRRMPSSMPNFFVELLQSIRAYSMVSLSRCCSSVPTIGMRGASPGFAWFSKMLVRPSSRIGSLATTPIRIGSVLYIADIEPLSLHCPNERWDLSAALGSLQSTPSRTPHPLYLLELHTWGGYCGHLRCEYLKEQYPAKSLFRIGFT